MKPHGLKRILLFSAAALLLVVFLFYAFGRPIERSANIIQGDR